MHLFYFACSISLCYSCIFYVNTKKHQKNEKELNDFFLQKFGVYDNVYIELYEYVYNASIIFMIINVIIHFKKIPIDKLLKTFTYLFLFRSIIIVSTDIPKIKSCDQKKYSNFFGGCYDKIFSGHVSIFYTMILFLITYTYPYILIYYVLLTMVCFLSIVSKAHYTIDIVIALIISYLNFYNFN